VKGEKYNRRKNRRRENKEESHEERNEEYWNSCSQFPVTRKLSGLNVE
jgi:hypothetical protein